MKYNYYFYFSEKSSTKVTNYLNKFKLKMADIIIIFILKTIFKKSINFRTIF